MNTPTQTPPRLGQTDSGVATLDGVPVYAIYGATARYGIHAAGDVLDSNVLVTQTGDGIDLTELWTEFQELLTAYNTETTSLCDLLRFPVTVPGSAVLQGYETPQFEMATEYGVPKAAGPPLEAIVLGYQRDDFDLRSAFTSRYLRDATAENVRAVMNSIVAADLKLVNGTTLRRLVDPNPQTNKEGYVCRGL